MDLATAAVEVLVAASSGLAGAGLFIWRVSAWKKGVEDRLKEAEETQKDQKKDIDENKRDVEVVARDLQDFADDQNRQWQEMNRALGQLEGATMGGNPNPRRTRP